MNSQMKIAFIGSGPVSLLRAYLIGKENPDFQITIIDQHENIGGAWYSDISKSNHEIESGCHIWSYCPEVYNYFRNEFELDLVPLKPSAVFIGNYINLPYSLKNSIDTYKFILKNLLRGKFKELKKVKSNPALQPKIFGKKNQYPVRGSVELITAMKSKIDGLKNVKFLINTLVESVHLENNPTLKLSNGEMEFDKIYLTSVSEIKKVISEGKTIELVQDRRDYIHLLLGSDQKFRKRLSYWRLMNDPVIHRISDISYQTDLQENLQLVGIKPDPFYSKTEDELLEHCIAFLRKKRVIGKNQMLERLKTYVFPTYYIKEGLRDQINKIAPDKIELIHSTDLIYGFYHILKGESLI